MQTAEEKIIPADDGAGEGDAISGEEEDISGEDEVVEAGILPQSHVSRPSKLPT